MLDRIVALINESEIDKNNTETTNGNNLVNVFFENNITELDNVNLIGNDVLNDIDNSGTNNIHSDDSEIIEPIISTGKKRTVNRELWKRNIIKTI